jgi:ketosteroid isomerase-like protein
VTTGSLTPEDRDAIHGVKARYFRLLDTKQWEAWGEVFTADAAMDMPEAKLYVEGRDEIVKAVRDILDDVVTVHHGHMGELEAAGPDEATAIWAMEDYLIWPPKPDERSFASTTRGYGHYFERYSRADGSWRIARTQLSRLHVETVQQYRAVTGGGR